MKKFRLSLLAKVAVAIALGILSGQFLPLPFVRVAVTFNAIFSQFLGFMIPFIIIGLVTPAIADIGKGAGKMLIATVAIAYIDTIFTGAVSYGIGSAVFPSMVTPSAVSDAASTGNASEPFFTVSIPAVMDVMSALVLSFIAGLCMAGGKAPVLKKAADEFKGIIEATIARAIIPLLPVFIFGIFLDMTASGKVYSILLAFTKVICVIFALHILVILYQFAIAGAFTGRNPFRLIRNMLPAYFTALGTSSSAATIPVTLRQTIANGVSEDIAGFTVPLCATIHMPGSAMKITACALTVCLMQGLPHSFPLFMEFILMLGIVMVAAPGVPGGAIMAALAPLSSILGFDAGQQALMIALYIAMDSFGTACNVAGDGAVALVVERIFRKGKSDR